MQGIESPILAVPFSIWGVSDCFEAETRPTADLEPSK